MKRVVFLILAWAVPFVALAANTSFLGPIVPQCTGLFCQACDLVKLADNILKFFVAFSIFGAAVMFAYAGFLYVTAAAKHDNLTAARKIFGSVFLGLIFVLTAWLIVDLSLRVLTNKSLNVLTVVQCTDFSANASVSGNGTVPNGQVQSVTNPVVSSEPGPVGTGDCGSITGTTAYDPGYGGIEGPVIGNHNNILRTVQACVNTGYNNCTIDVATGQQSGLNGKTFTWPELVAKYNAEYHLQLKPDTQFVVNDYYDVGYGNGTFDIARCSKLDGACTVGQSGGSFSGIGSPQCTN